jgi:hypothetical protein
MSGMPPSQAGVAAAVASTCRQVGATLGVAVVGAVAATGLSGSIGPAFASATHASSWIIVALGVVILILSLLTTTQWARRTARRHRRPLAFARAPCRAAIRRARPRPGNAHLEALRAASRRGIVAR